MDSQVPNLREKYKTFRILVIGRANAGKTTLLKRVCNTTEDPCIYNGKGELVLEPTAERGIHNINRAFAFKSNPQFVFHDSAGFETGDEHQLKEVQSFITQCATSRNLREQIHAIWFCLKPDISRPLLELEERFFNEPRAGNAPVIAIITKFDDLITQIYDENMDEEENRCRAENELLTKFEGPLSGYKFPPRACVFMEDLHDDDSNHQDQVMKLIKKTADSLDDITLKILFVSIQQNNLHFTASVVIYYGNFENIRNFTNLKKNSPVSMLHLIRYCLEWFPHTYNNHWTYETTQRGPYLVNDQYKIENAILKSLQKEFETPTIFAFAAIIICVENSWWNKSTGMVSTFSDAFQQALQSYVESGTMSEVNKQLEPFTDFPYPWNEWEKIESSIKDIVNTHFLRVFNLFITSTS